MNVILKSYIHTVLQAVSNDKKEYKSEKRTYGFYIQRISVQGRRHFCDFFLQSLLGQKNQNLKKQNKKKPTWSAVLSCLVIEHILFTTRACNHQYPCTCPLQAISFCTNLPSLCGFSFWWSTIGPTHPCCNPCWLTGVLAQTVAVDQHLLEA